MCLRNCISSLLGISTGSNGLLIDIGLSSEKRFSDTLPFLFVDGVENCLDLQRLRNSKTRSMWPVSCDPALRRTRNILFRVKQVVAEFAQAHNCPAKIRKINKIRSPCSANVFLNLSLNKTFCLLRYRVNLVFKETRVSYY